MVLAMLIGHSSRIDLSLFAPADTLASLLASHFPEAGPAEVQALLYAALVLLIISLLVNIAGTRLLIATQRRIAGTWSATCRCRSPKSSQCRSQAVQVRFACGSEHANPRETNETGPFASKNVVI